MRKVRFCKQMTNAHFTGSKPTALVLLRNIDWFKIPIADLDGEVVGQLPLLVYLFLFAPPAPGGQDYLSFDSFRLHPKKVKQS